MTVDYILEIPENLAKDTLPEEAEDLAGRVLNAFADFVELPYEASVSLTVTDDREIQKLNREFRNIDRSTDVLSFPAVQYEVPGDFSILEEMAQDAFDPDTGELFLGDIVISAEHVKAQAEAYGHSTKREFSFLMVHSLLHLVGYDHMTPEEAERMESMQRNILDGCGISR